MNSLLSYLLKLERRIDTLEGAFLRFALNRNASRKIDRFAFQAGLISETWQAWNSFSRSIILASLKGTTSTGGVAVNSPYSPNSVNEIRYAAMKAAQARPIGALRPISGDHLEPTWGDMGKANRIISALTPSNSSQLLSAFGSSVLISDLQKVRNACAHVSSDRLNDVRSMQVRYSHNRFLHPSDCIFWVDPRSRDYSWVSWVDEMKLVAMAAVI